MTNFIARGSRLLAVATLVGATAFTTAQATDWGQLKSSTWGGSGASDGASAVDAQGMSSATNAGSADVAAAFQEKGMESARADCYGAVLAGKLSPPELSQAAALIRTASNADDVRSAVMGAGPTIVGGFSAANVTCPEGMGG